MSQPPDLDPFAESMDSALFGLTLPEVIPDAAVIVKLQRALADGNRHRDVPSAPEVFAGRYRLERNIGAGAMGVVWEAQDLELRRRVAIKMLTGASDPTSLARMRREARAVAQLAHPNVAAIYDVVIEADLPFIAMEYVDGGDLRHWLDRAPRPSWTEVLDAFEQAGHGLAAAHGVDLIHRDFKPANVIVGAGRVRVVDFGLARLERRPDATLDDSGLHAVELTLTRSGAMVGTPAYMAPEQHAGGTLTAAADIFAYACSLYEALYGERPYRGAGMAEIAAAKRAGPPSSPPSNAVASGVPARLYPIVARGLAPDPDARWPSIGAFVQALHKARRRRPWAWMLAAAVPVAVAIGAASGTSEDPCARELEGFEREWAARSETLQRAVAEAGVNPALGHAVGQTLAEFGAGWTVLARDACTAERDDARSENLVDCLDGLRAGASERVARAAATPATARRFAHDLDVFFAIEECGPEALDGLQAIPADPDVRREIGLLRSWSQDATGIGEVELAAPELLRARATGHLPTVARVHLALARHNDVQGDAAAVLSSCEGAFTAATAGGSDWLALQAGTSCIGACSNLGRVDEARRWNGHIDALAQRLGVEPSEHQRGRGLLASALARAGDLDGARRLAAEIDAHTKEGPPWMPSVLDALAEIGMIAIWLDDYPLAIERLERGYTWAQQYRDDDDARISNYEGRLATAYRYVGRHAEAEALFLRTLARPLPPAQRLMSRLNYAQMLADQPARLDDAYAQLMPLHDELIAAGRQDTLDVAHVLAALGQVHLKAQRHADARLALTQARAIYGRHLAPEHISVQNVDQWLAKAGSPR